MHNHSYENEFNLRVNEISFSYEKMGTKTHFEEETEGNSEMAYWLPVLSNCPSAEYIMLMKSLILSVGIN